MGWIIAFAFVTATTYTFLNLPDYVLEIWRNNRSLVRAGMARLKTARTTFGQLEEIVAGSSDGERQLELDEAVERVRAIANPTILNIQTVTNSDIWNLVVSEDTSWGVTSAEFWRYWRPIWQMRQDATLIEQQVAETERQVNVLDALCDHLRDEMRASSSPPEEEPIASEDVPYADEELQEIVTAFRFSLRQETVESLLGLIEGEQAQEMQLDQLHDRGLLLEQALVDLEEAAWGEDLPDSADLDSWLTRLDEWREQKAALANEVEQIQRQRVAHERKVDEVQSTLDTLIAQEAESDLSKLAYEMLALSNKWFVMLDLERSADALAIATVIADGLPHIETIDKNSRALSERIPQTAGATRATLAQAVTRYHKWRTRLDDALTEHDDTDTWLHDLLAELIAIFEEKSEIIELLNEAIVVQKAPPHNLLAKRAIAEVWDEWNKIKHIVTVDDHWISQALEALPTTAHKIPADATQQVAIRNQAQKVTQALAEISADAHAWEAAIRQNATNFERSRLEVLEPAAKWLCLRDEVTRVEELMEVYLEAYQTPQIGWLMEKRGRLQEARQAASEQIRLETRQLQKLYTTLQNETERIRHKLRDLDYGERYDTVVTQLRKAELAEDVADARMALQSAKYTVG